MRSHLKVLLAVVFGFILVICSSFVGSETKTKVKMTTNYGIIVLELSNETPLHRDNFIKLVQDKAYDSLLFHRVIENFMIQGGDPDSKKAKPKELLGLGDLDYAVKAEFRPNLFHKKGALATAREDNLDRSSSAIQFFIVQGKVFNDSTLDRAENRINSMTARYHVINKDTTLFKAFKDAYENDKTKLTMRLNDSITALAEQFTNFERYHIPESHRDVYKTLGGTPHLDQNYTVFGEVIEGLEIVDSIAKVATDNNDRPLKDVRILSVIIIQ